MTAIADGFVEMSDRERLEYLYDRLQDSEGVKEDTLCSKRKMSVEEMQTEAESSRQGAKRSARQATLQIGSPARETVAVAASGSVAPGMSKSEANGDSLVGDWQNFLCFCSLLIMG